MYHVHKYGGSSQASEQALHLSVELLLGDPLGRIVVVSAPKGVTNRLKDGYEAQCATGEFPPTIYRDIKDLFLQNHPGIAGQTARTLIEQECSDELRSRIGALPSSPTSSDLDYHYARLLSFGEHLQAQLYALLLNQRGAGAQALSLAQTFHVNGNPRDARYDPSSDELLREQIHKDTPHITVIGGFHGYDSLGNPLVFSRGGSDLTQTLVMRALSSPRGFNCTDIAGIKPIDPSLLAPEERENVPTFAELGHRVAQELAYNGARVLHPRCLEPLISEGLELVVLSTFDPSGPRTVIRNVAGPHGIIAVTGKPDSFKVLHVATGRMEGASGYLSDIFQRLSTLNIETIATSVVGVTATFIEPDQRRVDEVKKSLEEIGTVEVHNGSSMLALVGNEISASPDLPLVVQILQGYGGLTVISKSADDRSIWFAVPEGSFKPASAELYRRIIRKK